MQKAIVEFTHFRVSGSEEFCNQYGDEGACLKRRIVFPIEFLEIRIHLGKIFFSINFIICVPGVCKGKDVAVFLKGPESSVGRHGWNYVFCVYNVPDEFVLA